MCTDGRIPAELIHSQDPQMTGPRTQSLLVGVSGGSCSGKTTLVRTLISRIGEDNISSIEHDCYYRDLSHRSPAERASVNYDHPDALETTLLIDHLVSLRKGQSTKIPVYDFARHVRAKATTTVHPRDIIIVEGILIYSVPTLRELLDLKIYVHTDPDIRLARRLQRDVDERGRTVDSVLQQYLATVRPGHIQFVEPKREFADIIISGANENAADIKHIAAKLNTLLLIPKK